MGDVAIQSADLVFVTADNPRSETVGAIAREILGGLENEGPIEFLLMRMSEHDNQPPADWDGVFRLQKK